MRADKSSQDAADRSGRLYASLAEYSSSHVAAICAFAFVRFRKYCK
jgi:hypothetical protein